LIETFNSSSNGGVPQVFYVMRKYRSSWSEFFYRKVVKRAMLYGTKCWALKNQHELKLSVAKTRMLRWMCGKTRRDKIRYDSIEERGLG